jgi:hypothetical protein
MIQEFEKLNGQEVELMLRAPIVVCILIAGADGTIDKKEINEAITTTGKQAKSRYLLREYLKYVAEDLEDKIRVLKQSYPRDAKERSSVLVAELAGLNNILSKISEPFASEFYAMLKELAVKVASSSGGWLGLNAVGLEEEQYVDLSMIQIPTR